MKPTELGQLLSIRPDNLTRRHLWPMVTDGILNRTYPDNPQHPKQAYQARQLDLPIDGDGDPIDSG
jgi:hypothetical protein